MQATPLLKSKLMIPELPAGALLTDRIKKLPLREKKATIMVAQGGFGKTTAILLALRNERLNVRWYRLEKEDASLPVFYTHLIETLFAGIGKVSLDSYKGLNGVSNIVDDYSVINALICQDAWTHFPADGPRHYLVLDDYHRVMDNSLIAESVRYFIANMPEHLGIIVSSRVEPDIYSGKLTLNNDVYRIGEDSLRFTRAEAEKLLLGVYKVSASQTELDAIFDYTEGWIAGLYLLSHIESPPQISAAQKMAIQPGGQELFNFFFRSFFKEMADDRLETLALMSIFSEFSRDDLALVLEIENADELLSWLESNNMYVQKFMSRPVKYRFHSMFRRELELYLQNTRSRKEISELYLKAARHYEKIGETGNAIQLYIAAEDMPGAVETLKNAFSRLFPLGKAEKVMYHISNFPESVVRSEPDLLFCRGCMLLTTDVDEAYACFRSALLMFRKKGDMTSLMNSFGMILVLSYQTNDFRYANEAVKHVPMLRVALSKSSPRKKLFIAAFISIVAGERLKLGALIVKFIERMRIDEQVWEYSFLVIRGLLFYRIGRLDEAAEIFYRVMRHPICQTSDQWHIIGMVGCHNSIWLRGDFEAAKGIMNEFASLGEKYDSDHCRSFAYRISAFSKFRENDLPGSIEDGQKNADMQKRYGSQLLASAAMIARYVKECILNPSVSWAEKAEAEFVNISKETAGHGYYELSRARLGFIYKYAGDLGRAEQLLLEAYTDNRKKGANQYTAMLAMHLADLYYLKNDRAKLEKYLRVWVRLSEKYDFVFFYLVDYVTLIRCCALAMQKGEPASARAYKIMRYYIGNEHTARLARQTETAVERPNEFAASCMKADVETAVNSVTLFGEFTVSRNGNTIRESNWKTRKISGILKYILTERGRYISRETLAAVFWPDSDTKAASASLRVALSEIRKCLAAHGMSFDNENAFIIETKAGFIVNDKINLRVDAEEFEALYNRLKKKEIREDEKENILTEMLKLYKDDLLSDSQYDDWISLRREHYRSLFVEASHALIRVYMDKGAYSEAEELLMHLLTIDPFDEKACRIFIKLCRMTQQQERADAFARTFKTRFYEEMGIQPDIVE